MDSPVVKVRNVEQRKRDRYQFQAPIFFFWEPPNGPARSNQGTTRDFSEAGIYVHGDEAPSVGELLDIDILLPSSTPGVPDTHLTGEGMVLRIEPRITKGGSASRDGFAATVKFRPELSELVLSRLKGINRSNLTAFRAQTR